MATLITSTSKQKCEATLNISIPENIWVENPKFAGLLVEIATKKLGKLSLHSTTWSKFEKQTEENDKIRTIYLEHKILFDAIFSVLNDTFSDDTSVGILATHALDLISIHFASHQDQPFIAKSYFETFIKDMDKPEGLKALRDSIVPAIEEKLTEIALTILKLLDSTTDPNKPQLWLAKLKQLPSQIDEEKKQHEKYKYDRTVDDKCLKKNLEILLRKQMEYSKMLQTYMEDNSDYICNKESSEANILLSKFQTMFEKLDSVDQQIRVDTYTAENVQALEIVHHKLIELKHSLLQEIHETKALLVSYGSLGPEYTLIVDEYGEVDKQIQAARDVLNKHID